MSSLHKTDVFLKKLYYIHEQCAPARKKQDEAEAEKNIDQFSRMRKDVAAEIRDVRDLITQRDKNRSEGVSDAIIVQQSAELRLKLRDIKSNIQELEELQKKHENELKSNTTTDEGRESISNERDVVDFAWKHLSQLESLERFGSTANEMDLFEEDEPILVGGIPDLDDPQFLLLKKKDQELDQGLDEIHDALKVVRELAETMNNELVTQDELISNIEDNVEDVQQRIVTVNSSLKKALKKVRGPRECLCNIIVCILILSIIVCVVYLILY